MGRVIVSVDPGTVTLGFAVWRSKTWGEKGAGGFPYLPLDAGLLNASHGRRERTGGSGFEQAALKVTDWLKGRLRSYENVEQIWCEKMEFRSSHIGIAAIDDVLGVSFACGCIARLARELGAAYHPAPVSEWKGNLTKVQVSRRILKKWGIENEPAFMSAADNPSHDWDAVGIGLWGQGFF